MFHINVSAPLSLVFAFTLSLQAHAEGFLGGRNSSHSAVDMGTRRDELQAAMGAVLGCGGEPRNNRSVAITRVAQPIWQSFTKNDVNRVDWRQLRYMAHRYFMQTSSIMIRGIEPVREINASHHGAAEILRQQVPGLVEMMLDGRTRKNGFSFEDAIVMIETLEQLVFNSETSLLEKVFPDHEKLITEDQLHKVLEEYMVHWMMGEDPDGIKMLIKKPWMRRQAIPQWDIVSDMITGKIKSMEFAHLQKSGPGSALIAMKGQYSFDDAHEVIADVGRSFASFWESECQAIKESLITMDKTGIGRVRLSDFYGANLDGEWRFGESETYLRELGALDETSAWRGKQVIIPNYLQATSNCIVSRPNYLVCCMNECEEILGEIEAIVGAPVAQLDDVLSVVQNITNFDDEPVKINEALHRQLRSIAETHGGKVPVHGRLFAQWLHFAFPRECPFPHKAGSSTLQTPNEYGDHSLATNTEIAQHKERANDNKMEDTDDLQWMSQWSEEEELIGDYSTQLRTPWQGRHVIAFGGALILAVAIIWAGVKGTSQGFSKRSGDFFEPKAHFV